MDKEIAIDLARRLRDILDTSWGDREVVENIREMIDNLEANANNSK